MKAQDYQAFVEQLEAQTPVQRDALLAALKSKKLAGDTLAAIETHFAADPACVHCGSKRFGTWGRANDLRWYKCKECERTFKALTGTPPAQLHCREKWLDYASAIVDGLSLRKAAARYDIVLLTSFSWCHRFLKAPKLIKAAKVTGKVEADETFDRELKPVVTDDAVLVLHGRDAYASFAHRAEILHVPIYASRGEYSYEGFHIQNVNGYISRLKGWMLRFRYVASDYLDSYLGWRRLIERDDKRLTPRYILAVVLGP